MLVLVVRNFARFDLGVLCSLRVNSCVVLHKFIYMYLSIIALTFEHHSSSGDTDSECVILPSSFVVNFQNAKSLLAKS